VAGGVRYESGERKAVPVRNVQWDWQPWDWEGESSHLALVARDARWRGREEAQDAEAQALKVIGMPKPAPFNIKDAAPGTRSERSEGAL